MSTHSVVDAASDEHSVAIIGMSGRFPGASSVERFWANLCDGVESIERFDAARLRAGGTDPAVLADRRFVPAGGVLEHAEDFDAELFGIGPAELVTADPQHRVLLECAWEALENAGYPPRGLTQRVGVFAGSGFNTHLARLRRDPELVSTVGELTLVMNNDTFRLPTMLSYHLNLRGPSVHVQTACSTSLVAVHLAAQSLVAGECDLALAGGVTIHFPQCTGYWYSEGGIGSPDGHCRPFDAAAAGTVFGNGAGLVVLRRYADAVRDGDAVVAVIRGSAVNNDGSDKLGYTAPGVAGQVEVIGEALAVAGVNARSIGYVEAHGTGTPLGDPIEVRALTEAYRQDTREVGYCALGSVKSNVGHLDTAAGVAGLIKAALAVRHGIIPATLHFRAPNPEIDFAGSPFVVAALRRDWPNNGGPPRRAAVSSFGLGGTNAHLIVEQFVPPVPPRAAPDRPQLLTWSAADRTALDQQRLAIAGHLDALRGDPGALADVAYTLRAGRAALRFRAAVVCPDAAGAAAAVRSCTTAVDTAGAADRSKLAFLFPGQGAPWAGTAAGPYQAEPEFRRHVDEGLGILGTMSDVDGLDDLRELMLGTTTGGRGVDDTLLSQCALFLVEYALARFWQDRGVRPSAMLGHSVGEYVAACLAGVFPFAGALRLLARRGQLMRGMPAGRMLAVGLSEVDATHLLAAEPAGAGVSVAAVNAPQRCVLSGPVDSIAALGDTLVRRGIACRELHTAHAFHSAHVEHVLEPFQAEVVAVAPGPPTTPFVSCVTGTWITAEQATDPSYWARHIREPVRYADGLACLAGASPLAYLEVGPGQTLTSLSRPQLPPGSVLVASMAARPGTGAETGLAEPAGRLWVAGVDLDLSRFGEPGRRRELPTYPFQRDHYAPGEPPAQVGRQAPAEAMMPISPTASRTPAGSATSTTRSRVRELFASALRVSPDQLDDETPFVAQGADSLTLLQASQLIRDVLGLTVPFRALLEEYPTVAALSKHLDATLPRPEPVPATLPAQTCEADADITGVIRGQLEVMAAQLALLGTGPESRPNVPAPAPALPAPLRDDGAPYVPYRPITPGTSGELAGAQRQHVEELAARLTARTARSRAAAQESREYLADERSSARFRLQWKEMQYPLVFARADGATIEDLDGNRYVDLTMGFGALLFGHNPPFVLDALREQAAQGLGLGLSSPAAGAAARLVRELTGLERVAFVNSGTDAVTVAIRLARTVTRRTRIATFAGSYHGSNDQTLVTAVSNPGGRFGSRPVAPGVLPATCDETVVLDYGSEDSLRYLQEHIDQFAAVLVEPVQSRHPRLRPKEFLRELSRITRRGGAALVLDEVITGFRAHPGGIRARWSIDADMCTFGKAAGGGVPIGMVGGRHQFLDAVDGGAWRYGDASYPAADTTYVAGTYFRHPLHLPVVVAVLERLRAEGPELQRGLERRTAQLVERLNAVLAGLGVPITVAGFSSWFVFEFDPSVRHPDLFFFHLLLAGIYIWEGRICYLSTAHTEADLERVVRAVAAAAASLRDAGLLGAQPAGPVDRPEVVELPLTDGQSEIWALSELAEDTAAANQLALALRLRGELRTDVLRDALDALARHEALRTSFPPGGRIQRVHPHGGLPLDITDGTGPVGPVAVDEWIAAQARLPVDAAHPPLLRASLLRLAADDHVLLLRAHHLVIDGRSAGLLVDELAAHYSATVAGVPAAPAPAMSYVDYVANRLAADTVEADRYWLDLHGTSPALDLPTDRPREGSRTFRSARVRAQLPPSTADRVRQLAAADRVTPTAVLLAAYVALLAALSGQSRVVVGAFADDQPAHARGPLVADAVSMLPLSFRSPAGTTLDDLARQAGHALSEGYEHRHFSLRRLIAELGLLSDTSRPPLVAATFNVDRQRHPDFAGLTVELSSVAAPAIGFDLAWNVVESAGRYSVECDYNAALFEADTIRTWIGYFADILADGHCRRPAVALLRTANATARPAPGASSVHELIDRRLRAVPDRTVLVGGDGQLTGGGLAARVNRIGTALRDAGVRPGSLVGLAVGRSTGLVAGVLAAWQIGAGYVPLDANLPARRLRWMIDDCAVRVVLTDRAVDAGIADLGARTVCIDDIQGDGDAWPLAADPSGGDRLAYLMYTSGSTGRPKPIAVQQSAVLNFADSMLHSPGLGADDVVLAVTTASFDISLLELVVPLCAGATVVVASTEQAGDGYQLSNLIDRHGVTVMQATPATWRMLLESGWEGRPGLRVLCGGEALPTSLADRLRERVDSVWNLYGPTECTIWSTVYRVDGPAAGGTVPIGEVIGNTSAYVVDELLELVPPGAAGELCLGGHGVSWGYWGRPGLTARSFVPDPHGAAGARMYRTGDLVRQRRDGVLSFLGRRDLQVKVRGFRIELGEIDATLVRCPGVTGCVTVAVADRLVSYLVPVPGMTTPPVAELQGFLRQHLPDYMVPAVFVPLDTLPLTPSGKVDRAALPPPDDGRPDVAAEYQAPRTAVERALTEVWTAVLGVSSIGVHDNFLEVGGDSVLAIEVTAKARAAGLVFPALEVLRRGTIAQLAETARFAEPGAAAQPAAGPATAPLLTLTDTDVERIATRLSSENR